jgi:hypothetical protein
VLLTITGEAIVPPAAKPAKLQQSKGPAGLTRMRRITDASVGAHALAKAVRHIICLIGEIRSIE